MHKLKESIPFSLVLHLLFPGWGYIFWKEYAFGLFVFLIMLMASALFFVSFLVSIPGAVIWLLISFPAAFFLFSFVDLARSVGKRRGKVRHSAGSAVFFLVLAVVYQILAPSTPTNFMARNTPELFIMGHDRLSPACRRGDILLTNRLAYSVNLFFFDRPVYHSLPNHLDVVRFENADRRRSTGLVFGLPGERIEVVSGELIINGRSAVPQPDGILTAGDWPLTAASEGSILVATMNLGRVDDVHDVSFVQLKGRVGRLF